MAIESPCFQVLKVCRIRAVRLDAAGAFIDAADNAVVTDAMTVLSYSPAVLPGEEMSIVSGCGDICVDFEDDDRPRGRGTATLTLCSLDAELMQALVGGTLLTSGGATVGYEPPGADDAPANGVAIEAWGWAWDTDEYALNDAGTRIYRRLALPLSKWTIGEQTNENAIQTFTLNGKVRTNSNFGTGPAGDWPNDVSVPGAWFWDETGTLPTPTCGYSTLGIAS